MYKPMTPVSGVGNEIDGAIYQLVLPWLTPVFIAITRFGNPAFFRAVFALNAVVLAGILVAPNVVTRFESETWTEAIS